MNDTSSSNIQDVAKRLNASRSVGQAARLALQAKGMNASSKNGNEMFEFRPISPARPTWELDPTSVPRPSSALPRPVSSPHRENNPPPTKYPAPPLGFGLMSTPTLAANLPEWRRAQPALPLDAPVVALPLQMVSFDHLHPAMTESHYLHTTRQRELIAAEQTRRQLEQERDELKKKRVESDAFASRVYGHAWKDKKDSDAGGGIGGGRMWASSAPRPSSAPKARPATALTPRDLVAKRRAEARDPQIKSLLAASDALQRETNELQQRAALVLDRSRRITDASHKATTATALRGMRAAAGGGGGGDAASSLADVLSAAHNQKTDAMHRLSSLLHHHHDPSSSAAMSPSPTTSKRKPASSSTSLVPKMVRVEEPLPASVIAASSLPPTLPMVTREEDLSPLEQQQATGAIPASGVTQQMAAAEAQAKQWRRRGDRAENIADGYDSDIEREEAARRASQTQEQREAELAVQRQREEEAKELEMKQTWSEQDAWMNAYRSEQEVKLLQYERAVQYERQQGGGGGGGGGGSTGAGNEAAPRPPIASRPGTAPAPTTTTTASHVDASTELDPSFSSPFLPRYHQEAGVPLAPEHPAGSPTPRTRLARRAPSIGWVTASPHTTTHARPFSFQSRDEARRKTLDRIKLEQQLALEAEEEEAARRQRSSFKARPVPRATSEPRFGRIMLEQAMRQAASHDARLHELRSAELPRFSFQEREEAAMRHREEAARERQRAAEEEARSKAFRANPVPPSTFESRFAQLQLETETRRQRMKEAADARIKAFVEKQAERQQEAEREASVIMTTPRRGGGGGGGGGGNASASASALRPSSAPHARRVPDFNKLHQQFENALLKVKATNPFRRTIPAEFPLARRDAPEVEAARAAEKARRDARFQAHFLDESKLVETRWPFMSTRAKVQPTKPPGDWPVPDELVVGETRTNRLRRQALESARKSGKFDSPSLRAERAEQEANAQRSEWAKQYVAKKMAEAREQEAQRVVEERAVGGVTKSGGMLPPTTTPKTTPTPSSARKQGPPMPSKLPRTLPAKHVEVRREQVAAKAREEYEDTLLSLGMDVYRYVEGDSTDDESVAARGGRKKAAALIK